MLLIIRKRFAVPFAKKKKLYNYHSTVVRVTYVKNNLLPFEELLCLSTSRKSMFREN